ncbi:hypothetical protein GIB67_000444 [Kingdonia uniflora]|uniref:DNA polymerase alpha subunit B n=1 Tax=Kingdonia uniflora TaxID=39325 RepID=A0A7J7MPZ0_9MAGN|nr:hypothetical protein GIB67_000444 [Kingdonia uniflora]
MEDEIKSEFEKSGFSVNEEEVLKKCLTFCINYKLKPSDLVSSWEVHYLNRQLSGSEVQNAHMDGFLLHLQNEQRDAVIKEESYPHVYSSTDIDMILSDEHEDIREDIIGTPTDRQERLRAEPPASTPTTNGTRLSLGNQKILSTDIMTPFEQRTNKFVVQVAIKKSPETDIDERDHELSNHEDDVIKRVQSKERCYLKVLSSGPERGCRFMYDRIEEKFNSLENRIRRHAAALVASGLEKPVDPTIASEETLFSVGMVCCDAEGRLNENSILLQGSAEQSGGQNVRLDLQKLTQFSFFPGQVVGIEGHNPSGHCLIASKVVDSIPLSVSSDLELPPSKKQAVDQEFQPNAPSTTSEELSLIVAAGPFTTTDNLLFQPLIELLAYASRKQPQLVMLLGPFVDSEHPDIKRGAIDRSFDDIFHVEILRRLQDYTEYMGSASRVILVPSIRDASHDFVFPQPAFDIDSSELQHQITCLANPGLFDANKVKIGCCTLDVLKHLSSEEISRIPTDGTRDRMGRLATHVLKQRRHDVPLDLSLSPESLQITSVPDILILPSDLAPFVKILSVGEISGAEEQVKCISVNPGRLAKGVGGGTFVELNYHGNAERANASVIRI